MARRTGRTLARSGAQRQALHPIPEGDLGAGPERSRPGCGCSATAEHRDTTLYRDGTNCKVYGQIRLTGPITPTQIAELRTALDDGLYYAPADIGHTHLGKREWPNGFPSGGVDHCWHEMALDEIEIVPTEDLAESGDHIENGGTPAQFLLMVAAASARGWQAASHDPDSQ